MNYTKVSADAFQHLQLNAGVVLSEFTPATGAFETSNIIGETSGGTNFKATVEYTDFGEDIDNMPKNTMELKRIQSIEAVMSGTFISVTPALAKRLVGAADVASDKVTPRINLATADFDDVWWVGDYGDVNTGNSAGFVAIHLINSLNTNGFEIQSSDDGKGTFPFEFTGHFSLANQDQVPYEIYIHAGTASANG